MCEGEGGGPACACFKVCEVCSGVEGEERFKIMPVQMHNVRGLLGIRRIYRMPNPIVKELRSVKKRMDQSFLLLFGHTKRENSHRIAKRIYKGRGMGVWKDIEWIVCGKCRFIL